MIQRESLSQSKRIGHVRQTRAMRLLLFLLFLLLVFLFFLSLLLVVVLTLLLVLLLVRAQSQIAVIRFHLTLEIRHLAGPVLALLLLVLLLERWLCHQAILFRDLGGQRVQSVSQNDKI